MRKDARKERRIEIERSEDEVKVEAVGKVPKRVYLPSDHPKTYFKGAQGYLHSPNGLMRSDSRDCPKKDLTIKYLLKGSAVLNAYQGNYNCPNSHNESSFRYSQDEVDQSADPYDVTRSLLQKSGLVRRRSLFVKPLIRNLSEQYTQLQTQQKQTSSRVKSVLTTM